MIILRQKIYKKSRSTVYLLVGLPGSGKSTWCRKNYPNLPVISRDIIRYKLGYTSSPDEKTRLSIWEENLITKKEDEYIIKNLKQGRDFIIDDTNLKLKYRKPLIDKLKRYDAYVIGVNFLTPLKTCIKRRKDQINPGVLLNMKNSMDKLDSSEVDEIINVK